MKNLPVKAGPFKLDRYDIKRRNDPVLSMPPAAPAIAAIAMVIAEGIVAVAPALAGAAAYNISMAIAAGLVYGASMAASSLLSSALAGSPKTQQTNLSRSPHLINTRDTDEVVMPSYGEFRKGCNWIFADESGGHNKYLNLVLTWAEGLCNGLIYTTDYKPNYMGSGKNDMRIKGTFSGAATREFKVQIDGVGSGPGGVDTFKWSINDGSSWVVTTVAMTGSWQTLQESVQIKFPLPCTGHTNNNSWTWMAGLGLWVGGSLLGLFEAFGSSNKDLADHYWHNGSKTQTVDTNLQTECPLYADANARTCYSYLRLKYNIQAFPSGVQDFFALAKWRHLFDPREVAHSSTDETTWAYSNNAALVALDWVIRRFGMDRPWARVDETSVEAAANWCDANTMTFNGAILDEQSPEDTLRDIELCYRGFHFERDSKLVFGTFADDTAVMTFTEDDVMIDPEGFVIEIPGMPETPDRVVAWYQEPIENYAAKQVYYPQDNSLASDTGINEMELNLIGVTSRTKATQLAKYHYLRAVYNKTYSLTLSPRSYALEPGNMIAVTHTFPGWSATKVRVLGFGVQQDNGWFTFNVIQENSAIYNTDVNVSDDDIFIEPGVYTYPPDIATGSVTAKGDGFKVFITAPEEIDITGYVVYVFTANTVASSVVIKRISGHPSSDTIHLGTVSETGGITLTTAIPYYFWVTALDENGHESLNKFYLGTATSGAALNIDTTVPVAPAGTPGFTLTPLKGKNKDLYKWALTWAASSSTDVSGYNIEITDNNTSVIVVTTKAEKGATAAYGKGLEAYTDAGVTITYKARVQTCDVQGNETAASWSAYSNDTSGVDTTVPANPTDIVLTVKADEFEITFTKSTSEIMKNGGYKLYAWGSDDSGSALIIGDISHPAHKFSIKVGASTYYTGGGNASLAFNTTYYFWVEAYSGVGVPAASKAATNPTNAKLFKNEWLRSFTNPWKMTGKATYHYKRTTAGTTTHTVNAGKVALLEGYSLKGDNTNNAGIYVTGAGLSNYNIEYNSTSTQVNRSPSFTNGLYLSTGDAVTIFIDAGGSGCEAKCKIMEFDLDANIPIIIKLLESGTSYTVPTGIGLIVTFVTSYYGSALYLQQYLNSAWENVVEVDTENWVIGNGCLYFPSGAIIQGSINENNLLLIGFLGVDI